jgi:methionyl-tRNA formyltransferase
MRTIVFGYHNIGHACLSELLALGEEVVAVVTHHDDPGEEIYFRSVGELAERRGIPCFRPDDANEPSFVERLRQLRPEIVYSFYYRRLLASPILELPPRGALNLHGSLLPKYRGRCPVNWVLIHGEAQTGVTLHHMTKRADAGDVVAQETVTIAPRETAFTLMAKLESAAVLLLRRTVPLLRTGAAPRIPQDPTQATTFGGRRPEDGRIDWRQPAVAIDRLVRAVTHPYPGAFTIVGGRKLFVWESLPLPSRAGQRGPAPGEWAGDLVGTGDGLLRVVRCQIEGESETSGVQLAAEGSWAR